ncbi:hypothetical protein OROMI_030973 [Orobanche minor]
MVGSSSCRAHNHVLADQYPLVQLTFNQIVKLDTINLLERKGGVGRQNYLWFIDVLQHPVVLIRWRRHDLRSDRSVPNRGTQAHRNATGSDFGSLINRTERLAAIDLCGAQNVIGSAILGFNSFCKTQIEDELGDFRVLGEPISRELKMNGPILGFFERTNFSMGLLDFQRLVYGMVHRTGGRSEMNLPPSVPDTLDRANRVPGPRSRTEANRVLGLIEGIEVFSQAYKQHVETYKQRGTSPLCC